MQTPVPNGRPQTLLSSIEAILPNILKISVTISEMRREIFEEI
jgi:hypothetical protein